MVGIGIIGSKYIELSKVLIDTKYFREGADDKYLRERIKQVESKI